MRGAEFVLRAVHPEPGITARFLHTPPKAAFQEHFSAVPQIIKFPHFSFSSSIRDDRKGIWTLRPMNAGEVGRAEPLGLSPRVTHLGLRSRGHFWVGGSLPALLPLIGGTAPSSQPPDTPPEARVSLPWLLNACPSQYLSRGRHLCVHLPVAHTGG